ncbi:hypothetical protein SAMN05216174_101394 [Actinokineospora iranica]|uniref:Uncharacterized protein n=1 Tax=Actinokineospora iranica TaxID=1271860 RepID=A0A1G6JGL8_9PSEU|nr:hypothetical protein SAMN05216174_101394 [Actinokineospora iranica]
MKNLDVRNKVTGSVLSYYDIMAVRHSGGALVWPIVFALDQPL